jgi:hypothetical protein
MLGIASDFVEVNHGVKMTRHTDPLIRSLSVCLCRRSRMVIPRSHKGKDCRAEHFVAVGMSAHDHLLIGPDHVANQRFVFRLRNVVVAGQGSNVVDSLENDQVTNRGLREYVIGESR